MLLPLVYFKMAVKIMYLKLNGNLIVEMDIYKYCKQLLGQTEARAVASHLIPAQTAPNKHGMEIRLLL